MRQNTAPPIRRRGATLAIVDRLIRSKRRPRVAQRAGCVPTRPPQIGARGARWFATPAPTRPCSSTTRGTAHASGDGDGDETYYLIPVDAVAGSRDALERTAISSVELSLRLRAIPASRVTLVLDCWRAADLAAPRLAPAVASLAQGRGRVVLAASRATDYAYALPGRRNSTGPCIGYANSAQRALRRGRVGNALVHGHLLPRTREKERVGCARRDATSASLHGARGVTRRAASGNP